MRWVIRRPTIHHLLRLLNGSKWSEERLRSNTALNSEAWSTLNSGDRLAKKDCGPRAIRPWALLSCITVMWRWEAEKGEPLFRAFSNDVGVKDGALTRNSSNGRVTLNWSSAYPRKPLFPWSTRTWIFFVTNPEGLRTLLLKKIPENPFGKGIGSGWGGILEHCVWSIASVQKPAWRAELSVFWANVTL